MSIWRFLKNRRTVSQQTKKYDFILGEQIPDELMDLATQETLNLENSNTDSLAVSLPDPNKDEFQRKWLSLSPREQEVTALTCLRYTDRQIAARLSISKFTVRTYIEKVLVRFEVQSKADLRVKLANWDFSAWERRSHQR